MLFKNLPSVISGDGRNFVKQLKSIIDNMFSITNQTMDYQVEGVAIEEAWDEIDGRIVNNLVITFDSSNIPDYAYSELYRVQNGSYKYLDSGINEFAITNVKRGEVYTLKVIAVNAFNKKSDITKAQSVSHTVQGSRESISTPLNFSLSFDSNGVEVKWDAVTDADLSLYELRLDENVGSTTNLIKTTTNTTLRNVLPQDRNATLYLYAKNQSGYYSLPATFSYEKAYPYQPQGIVITKSATDIIINFNQIPYNCTGANIYIYQNDQYQMPEPRLITTNQYVYDNTLDDATALQIAYVDYFGEGSLSDIIPLKPTPIIWVTSEQNLANRSYIDVRWNPVIDDQFDYYKVKLGNSWDDSVVIESGLTQNSLVYKTTTEGVHRFWVVAYNKLGNHGTPKQADDLQVTLKPNSLVTFNAGKDERDRSWAMLSWTASTDIRNYTDIDGYVIRYGGSSFDNSTNEVFTKELSYRYTLQNSGTYNFFIKAKTISNWYSSASVATNTYMLEPEDVENLKAEQITSINRGLIRLTWDKINKLDISHYEVKEGINWESAESNTQFLFKRVGTNALDVYITEERQHKFLIKAVSLAGKYSLNTTSVTGIWELNPAPPTLSAGDGISQSDLDKSQITLKFTGNGENDLNYYEVKEGLTWDDNAPSVAITKNTSVTFTVTTTGDKNYIIKARNLVGFYSPPLNVSGYIKVEPSNITVFTAVQDGEYMQYYWNKVEDKDVTGYEIREGFNFDNGEIIATGITDNTYESKLELETTYIYWIKAINRIGKYSLNAPYSMVIVDGLPPKNILQETNEMLLKNGTHNNTTFGANSVNFATLQNLFPDKTRFSDYPTTRFSEAGTDVVLKLAESSPGVYYSSGTYTTTVKDIGAIAQCKINVLFTSFIVRSSGVLMKLQYRTSNNNITWSDWSDFNVTTSITKTFRYIQFKTILTTEDTSKTPELTQFKIYIDVPDYDTRGTTTVAVGGTTIQYGHTYWNNPVVVPSAVGSLKYADLEQITTTNFTVRVRNVSDNSDVGGTVTWLARGF